MNKKKMIVFVSAVVALIIAVTGVLLLVNKKPVVAPQEVVPEENNSTEEFLSTAIRVMSDSEFSGIDLARRIYIHAFSNSSAFQDTFAATSEETLNLIVDGYASEKLLRSIVPNLYGGTLIEAIEGVDGKPCDKFALQDMNIGDILLLKNAENVGSYIKDKDCLVDLSNAVLKTDAEKVLGSLSQCDVFVVFRPIEVMENYDFISKDAPKSELNELQKAVIATAESYLLRGDKLQYADTRLGGGFDTEFRWQPATNTPEDNTSVKWGYTNCAAFVYDVYYYGLGYDLESNGHKLYTTSNFASHSEQAGICKYSMSCEKAETYTDDDKEKIKKEIYDVLQPADILVVRRGDGNGHAMLYVGDGNIIHSSGAVYNLNESKENYEATIRRMRFNDYFFTEGAAGYIFGCDTGAKVLSFQIIRPLDKWEGEIPEETKNRVKNLQGVMAQKTASHNRALTVNPAEEITYTYEIYNMNDYSVELDVSDVVPQNTTYIEGAESVSGDKLSWSVEIPANTREKLSFKVKVNADTQYGDTIDGSKGMVGGVPVRCESLTINHTLTSDEQEILTNAFDELKESKLNGLSLVNEMYYRAFGVKNVFNTPDFDTVLRGGNGVFFCDPKNYDVLGTITHIVNDSGIYYDMLVPTMYGGRSLKGEEWTDRTRLARKHHLVTGDVLLRKTTEAKQIFLYIGGDKFYNISEGIVEDDININRRLEACIGTANCYAVLRPSFAMK